MNLNIRLKKSIIYFNYFFIINIALQSCLCFASISTENNNFTKEKFENFLGSASPWLGSNPKSLSEQKLTPSSFPDEAELNCGTKDCRFGLSRGLIIGGNLFNMIYAPFRPYFDSNWKSGSLSLIDFYGGFQILKDVDAKNYMSAQLGYRRIHFNDHDNTIAGQGLTASVNYTQVVTSIYSQSMEFNAFFIVGNITLNHVNDLNISSPQHKTLNDSINYYYRISQNFPTYEVSFPADLELVNWNSNQTGLRMPVRGYFEIAPLFIENIINFNENNISFQRTEQNFGGRFSAIFAYESSAEERHPNRYSIKTQLGFELMTKSFETKSSGNADLDLPNRATISPVVQVTGSWQF